MVSPWIGHLQRRGFPRYTAAACHANTKTQQASGRAHLEKVPGLTGVPELEHLKMGILWPLQFRSVLPAAPPIGPEDPPGNPVWIDNPPKRFPVAGEELFPGGDAP